MPSFYYDTNPTAFEHWGSLWDTSIERRKQNKDNIIQTISSLVIPLPLKHFLHELIDYYFMMDDEASNDGSQQINDVIVVKRLFAVRLNLLMFLLLDMNVFPYNFHSLELFHFVKTIYRSKQVDLDCYNGILSILSEPSKIILLGQTHNNILYTKSAPMISIDLVLPIFYKLRLLFSPEKYTLYDEYLYQQLSDIATYEQEQRNRVNANDYPEYDENIENNQEVQAVMYDSYDDVFSYVYRIKFGLSLEIIQHAIEVECGVFNLKLYETLNNLNQKNYLRDSIVDDIIKINIKLKQSLSVQQMQIEHMYNDITTAYDIINQQNALLQHLYTHLNIQPPESTTKTAKQAMTLWNKRQPPSLTLLNSLQHQPKTPKTPIPKKATTPTTDLSATPLSSLALSPPQLQSSNGNNVRSTILQQQSTIPMSPTLSISSRDTANTTHNQHSSLTHYNRTTPFDTIAYYRTTTILHEDHFLLSDQCPICNITYQHGDRVCLTVCNHAYHLDCIYTWFQVNQTNKVCPICRTKLQD